MDEMGVIGGSVTFWGELVFDLNFYGTFDLIWLY